MTRPCILLTTASRVSSYFLRADSLTGQNYSQAVAAAGGLPVVVSSLGQNLRATGQASDGVVEAIEGGSDSFVLGVQWHPEMNWRQYPDFAPFKLLLEAVRHRQLTAKA